MRKKILILILIVLIIFSFSSCEEKGKEGINICCLEFFSYDFCREILGDNPSDINLILLNETGQDMHSFEPSVSDLGKLKDSDLVFYLGGASEAWANEFFENNESNAVSLVDLFLSNDSLLNDYDLEEVETIQELEEEEEEIDEHIYLSPNISSYLVLDMAKEISNLDKENESYYLDNAENYSTKLKELVEEITQTKKVLVCDRFPFNYLFQDLNLSFVAAFDGCSTDINATFDTIINLCNIVIDENINDLVIIEKSSLDLVNTIKDTTKKELNIYTLNSLQSISKDEMDKLSYYDILKEDINILKKVTN